MNIIKSNQSERVNFPNLDIMKLVMAFFVVEIHTRPLRDFPAAETVIEGVDAAAVPFFFIVSAFLCFRGFDESSFLERSSAGAIRVRKTTGKLLRLYLTWTALFLPVTVFGSMLHGDSVPHAVAFFVRGTFFVGENYYSWPLWYLLASVIGFALVYICLRGGYSPKRILAISLLFLLAGFGITTAQNWDEAPAAIALPIKAYGLVFGSSRNGLFEGFFYIAVGAVFGMKWQNVRDVPVRCMITLAATGLIGCIFVSNDAHLLFCALASAGLFLLSIRRCGLGLNPHVMARNASTIIYLVHMYFVVLFVYGICGATNPDLYANDVNRVTLYLFALGGSATLSALVIPLAKKIPALRGVFGI